MGLFSKPTREELEKDITKKEIEISNLKDHIRNNEARIENYKRSIQKVNYDTLEWENQRDEKRIIELEKQISNLKKDLLRL